MPWPWETPGKGSRGRSFEGGGISKHARGAWGWALLVWLAESSPTDFDFELQRGRHPQLPPPPPPPAFFLKGGERRAVLQLFKYACVYVTLSPPCFVI